MAWPYIPRSKHLPFSDGWCKHWKKHSWDNAPTLYVGWDYCNYCGAPRYGLLKAVWDVIHSEEETV